MKNQIQIKLTNYEVAPPAYVWDDIEASLNDQATPHAALLYNFEQAPPSDVWNKIDQSLGASNVKVVPLTKKIHFSRYAAAAAMLLIIASAITFFITRQNRGSDLANVPSQVNSANTDSQIAEKSDSPTNKIDETVNTNNNEKDNSTATSETKKVTSGRYMTISDEEGKKVRLSKKVASVFNCADDIASVKALRCKEDIESLQNKISASLISPSGDFSGLIDMIKSLEENN